MFKRFLKFLFYLSLFIAVSGSIGLIAGDYIYNSQRFPPNCSIENIDVSRLTPKEAAAKLRAADVDSAVISDIELYFEDRIFSFKPSELGVYIQPVNTANRAFLMSYEPSYFKDLLRRQKREATRLPLTLGVDASRAGETLKKIAEEIDIIPKDAEFYIKDRGKYVIKREVVGRALKVHETVRDLKLSLFKYGRGMDLIVEPSLPRVFSKDLSANPPVWNISKFTTRYGEHDDPGRVHNIKLSAKKIDNYIVPAGEAFSLLDAFGDLTKLEGYKEAMVIISGELVPQYGGGVCQVATTLYNAALLADLKIKERRSHAIYFSIYPLGLDAMVYAGEADLRIKNNYEFPILIKSYATDTGLTFKIYGSKINKEVSFSKTEIYADGKLMEKRGIGVPEENAFAFDRPFSTKIIKYVKENGKIVSTEIIRSRYRSQSQN